MNCTSDSVTSDYHWEYLKIKVLRNQWSWTGKDRYFGRSMRHQHGIVNKQARPFLKQCLRNKTCLPCLHSLVKTEANVWENSRADQCKTRDAVEGFHLLKNSHKLCRGFHQAIKARRTYLIYFLIFFFCLNKEKDDIRSVYATVNSHNLETTNHMYCSRHFRAS